MCASRLRRLMYRSQKPDIHTKSLDTNKADSHADYPRKKEPSLRKTLASSEVERVIPADIAPYGYGPLKDDEIRLFHIEVSERFEDPITGQFGVANLTAKQMEVVDGGTNAYLEAISAEKQYTALSYAWGPTYDDDSHLTDFIICDGFKVKVTANLHQALKRIREALTVTHSLLRRQVGDEQHQLQVLWIDAICINQDDPRERSSQVRMMAQIFNQCKNLIIWLGERDEGYLGECQYEFFREYLNCGNIAQFLQDITIRKKQNEQEVLQSLLARPWFNRRWVIQEAAQIQHAAPNDVSGFIMLGDLICPREQLTSLLEDYGMLEISNPLHVIPTINVSVFEILFIYDESKCQDPRDRIFAIKNLCRHRMWIQVDYNKDIRDTYLSLVRTAVLGILDDDFAHQSGALEACNAWPSYTTETTMMLALASCKSNRSFELGDFGMEAWLPDWTAESQFDGPQHREAVRICLRREHCKWMPSQPPFVPGLVVSRNGYSYFSIQGILVSDPRLATADTLKLGLDFNQTDSLMQWAKRMFNTAKEQQQRSFAKLDRLWLPMALYEYAQEGVHWTEALAFVLRPSRQQTAFNGFPVYRLIRCFLTEAPTKQDLERPDNDQSWSAWATLTGVLSWERFLLE